MSLDSMEASRARQLDPVAPDSRGDRQGLDLLAAAVEEVAMDLSSQPSTASWPPIDTRATTRRQPTWLAVAAILASVILAWPAYLGLVRLPRVTAELQAARVTAVPERSGGPVEMKWLSPPRSASRSAAAPVIERVERRAGRSAVWLLEVPMDRRPDLAEGARIEIAGGNTRLGWELDAVELTHQLEAHDGVVILVHHDDLALGSQRIRLIDVAGQEVVAVELLVAAGDGS